MTRKGMFSKRKMSKTCLSYMYTEDDLQSGEYFWYEKEDRVHALHCVNRYSPNSNEESDESGFRFSYDLYSSSETDKGTHIKDAEKLQAMMEPEVSIISIMFHYLEERIREPICLKTQRARLSYSDGKDGRVWHMSFIKEHETSRRHFLFYEKDMNIKELEKMQ